MKKTIVVIITVLSFSLLPLFVGCNKTNESGETGVVNVPSSENMFTDRDKDSTFNSDSVQSITSTNETISIMAEGTYLFEGDYSNTSIVIEAKNTDKIQLVLNNANITANNMACIYIKSADKVFVSLYGDNYLTSIGEFASIDDNNIDGAIFSKSDLTINGEGCLTISSQSDNGIVCKDDLVIVDSTITVVAEGHSIDANDSIRLSNCNLTLTSGKDGLHSENTDNAELGYIYSENAKLSINTNGDGLDSSSSVQISGGELLVQATGNKSNTQSQKGIKGTKDILINSGSITVTTYDDTIHSNGNIEINGGDIVLNSGDDGIHADSSLVINGGDIVITKSYEGIEGNSVTINDGKVSVVASDDGINAAGGVDGSSIGGRPGQNSFSSSSNSFITINGGTLYINAGGDGLDSNGNMYINGGYIIVEGSTNSGNGAMDYDGVGQIKGGTFLAIGASGMSQNFGTSSTQGSILINISRAQSAGSVITLSDNSGNLLFSYTTNKAFQSIVISTPDIIKGNSYQLTTGTLSTTITMSSVIYGSGGGQSGGGGGFFPR